MTPSPFLLLVIFLALPSVFGFASWLSCYSDLVEGEYIMSHPAVLTDERYLQLWRGDVMLTAGDGYIPGETLEVRLSSPQGQFVLEVAPSPPVTFTNGTCNGRRFVKEGGVRSPKKPSFIEVPVDYSGELSLWGGWAEGYDVVKLTPRLTVKPAEQRGEDL